MFARIRFKVVCMFVLFSLAASARGADPLDRFVSREFDGGAAGKLNYQLLRPKAYDESEKYPLVVFLHGAGERGDDNKKQLVHGMSDFASDDVADKHPAFVIAPQCPQESRWVEVDWSSDSHSMPAIPSKPLALTLDLIDEMQKKYSIDPDRIYVTGLSMGGYGAWDAIQRRPVTFAAALPICGGGDPTLAKSINHVPIWCFHGADDTVVKPERSRQMIDALKSSQAKPEPKYTEYEGVGHNSWSATYKNREVLDWLFAQKRKR